MENGAAALVGFKTAGVEVVPAGPVDGDDAGPVIVTAPHEAVPAECVEVKLPNTSVTLSPRPKVAPAVTGLGDGALLTVTLLAAAAATLR